MSSMCRHHGGYGRSSPCVRLSPRCCAARGHTRRIGEAATQSAAVDEQPARIFLKGDGKQGEYFIQENSHE